jgi:hypothetical protein
MGGCGLDSSGSREGPVTNPFEKGDEFSGHMKLRKFIDQPGEYWFLKKDSGPWGWSVDWLVS